MRRSAPCSIDTGSAGELALHLRVKDGVADVRVTGAAAHTVEMRPSELRAALASEGLTLGSPSRGSRRPTTTAPPSAPTTALFPRPPSRALPAAVTSTTNDSSTAAVTAGRGLHVTA